MIDYLRENPLQESLILSIDHDDDQHQAEFAYSYAAEIVSRHFESLQDPLAHIFDEKSNCRDFRNLRLRGVSEFDVKCNRPSSGGYGLSELKRKVITSAICVTFADIQQVGQLLNLNLQLDGGFRVNIVFESATVDRIIVRGEKITGRQEWMYFDVETGERVDFNSPFA